MKRSLFFIVVSGLLFLPLSAALSVPVERASGRSLSSDVVKVLLSRPRARFDLVSASGFRFLATSNRLPLLGTGITNIAVTVSNRLIHVDGQPFRGNVLTVAAVPGGIGFGGRRYRGDLLLLLRRGALIAVNRINIELYLQGVLPHEINHRWPVEALKAQAIAARSYAVVKMRENRNRFHDLDNSAYSQVYRGMGGEKESTNDAVKQTAGLVLSYRGKTAVGFFHASCGGMTEASERVWSSAIPYLRSRRSPWCRGSRYYNWGVVLSQAEVRRHLRINAPLKSARVLAATPSGRVIRLLLTDRHGKRYVFPGRDFRRRIGYNRLRSRLFRLRLRGPYLQILGRGWGHGVGMCQWCAFGMAKKGMSALSILSHFYPGTRVTRYRVRMRW